MRPVEELTEQDYFVTVNPGGDGIPPFRIEGGSDPVALERLRELGALE